MPPKSEEGIISPSSRAFASSSNVSLSIPIGAGVSPSKDISVILTLNNKLLVPFSSTSLTLSAGYPIKILGSAYFL